ncbi:MAG: hypothetical protein ABSB01_21100 [Streptosporangiaceae bacterium]|jgi:hypothetical protein
MAEPRTALVPVAPGTFPDAPIRLGDGEVIYRRYRVSQLRTRKQGEGTLYITDSRVVFFARAKGRGTQRPSMLVQQTRLADVSGLAAYVTRRISLLLLAATTWFALLTLVSLRYGTAGTTIVLLILTAACGAALVIRGAKRGTVGVTIHAKGTQASPIEFGQWGQPRGLFNSFLIAISRPLLSLFGVFTALDVLTAFPGPDSEQLITELGALILDLQTRGSMAGEHWGVEAGQVRAPGPARSA